MGLVNTNPFYLASFSDVEKKKKQLQMITAAVNTVGEEQRTAAEIKKKWIDLANRTKLKERRKSFKTFKPKSLWTRDLEL